MPARCWVCLDPVFTATEGHSINQNQTGPRSDRYLHVHWSSRNAHKSWTCSTVTDLPMLHLVKSMHNCSMKARICCSWRSMYRILDAYEQVRERRDQLTHPTYKKPELLAQSPNELWSWDITKLRGPQKWTYFYLYVLMDIFSRFVVGWMVARQESAVLAKELIQQSCQNQEIDPDTLTIHSDRGGPMTARSLALLLSDLGVTKSHSRPHVPDDNPYSEAQFKTMKYRPDYPDRFGCPEDVRGWGRNFFSWYNFEHHHTGLGLMTPATVHYGQAPQVQAQRQRVLEAAFAAHPERFVRGRPTAPTLPEAVWINKPKTENLAREILP